MNLFDLFEFLIEIPNLLSTLSEEKDKRPTNYLRAFSILFLIIGGVWFISEFIIAIKQLSFPALFIGLYLIIGIIISVLLIASLFWLGFIKPMIPKDFVLIVLSISINLVCITSLFNRTNDFILMDSKTLGESKVAL